MVEVTLGGEVKRLKFSHIAMKSMEKHYNMSFSKIFQSVDMDSIENIGVMIWACMKRYDKSISLEDVEELLDDALDAEETTYEKLGDIIKEVFETSTLVKTLQKKQPKNKKGA